MTDNEVAQELIRRGLISPAELTSQTLAQVIIKRDWISPEELNQGRSIFDVLRRRGII
jgi:hypothetical protein